MNLAGRVTTAGLLVVSVLFVNGLNSVTEAASSGAKCTKTGMTQKTKGVTYVCKKTGSKLLWVKTTTKTGAAVTPTTTVAPTVKGTKCSTLGARVLNDIGYLECRYVRGAPLEWIQLSKTPPTFVNLASAQDVSKCKLKGEYVGNHLSGFVPDVSLMGEGNVYPRINPSVGVNDAIIIPVDYPDFEGDKNLGEIIKSNREQYLKWINYFSSGRLKTNLDFVDSWIRMPKETSFYRIPNFEGENDHRTNQGSTTRLAQAYLDHITKMVDLTKYRTVFLLFPSDPKPGVLDTGFPPRMVEFTLKEGKRTLSVFGGIGHGYDYAVGTPPWAMWIHEISHDWGLYGHAPGNGWMTGILVNQSGVSQAMNAWERFLVTWMPDSLVYCDTKETLRSATVQLSALERSDQQTKMIAIALDAQRLLVVEAHGHGEWFQKRRKQVEFLRLNIPDNGFYYVVAYVVDTSFRGSAPLVNPDGSALREDDGNDPSFPRHAYFRKVDGGVGSHNYTIVPGKPSSYFSYAAVQGDSFTIEGIKIEFLSTGDYETIAISKA